MVLMVQVIGSIWHKDERGGQFAQKRTHIRDAYPIKTPTEILVNGQLCMLDFPIQEKPNYLFESDRLRFGEFVIVPNPQTIEIYNLAVIQKNGHPQRLAELKPAAWVQIKYNHRHTETHHAITWWYENVTLNIGFVDEVKRNSFLKTEPHQNFDYRTDLYRLGRKGFKGS